MTSFQPFAARAQGKAYNGAARGQKGHQMGQPFMSVFAAFVSGLDDMATNQSVHRPRDAHQAIRMVNKQEPAFQERLTKPLYVKHKQGKCEK